MNNIFGDITNWFNNVLGNPTNIITNWFQSLAGQIASAIEGGVIAIFKDLFDVVVGPLEIVVGAVTIVIGVFLAVKGDMFVGSIVRML